MSLRDKMAAKRVKKLAAKTAAAQPQWAIDRVYKSASVLETLRNAGDDETVIRPIQHSAQFKSQAEAGRFAAGLKPEMGYTDIVVSAPDDRNDCSVSFHESSDTHSKSIFDKSVIADGRVREAGGTYDGWHAEIIKP